MFKISIPAVGHLIFGTVSDGSYVSLELRQLHAGISFGEAGEDYGSIIFYAYLFKGWDYRTIPITKDLFEVHLGCKA